MTHSFLLIGQSNAAGRGFINEAEPLDTCGGNLLVLRNGKWLKMYRPVNPDRPFSGVTFAESFAKAYYEMNSEVKVGIIPCADGGTKIEQWMPGEILFDNAVNCAKLAMRTSNLVVILWHQGESDCKDERYIHYTERFRIVMDALRKELGMPDIPILVGGLGDYLTNCTYLEGCEKYPLINEQLERLAKEYHRCYFVSAKGLGANPDNLHFNADAQKEFGLRYFDVFKNIEIDISDFSEIKEDAARSAIELL